MLSFSVAMVIVHKRESRSKAVRSSELSAEANEAKYPQL